MAPPLIGLVPFGLVCGVGAQSAGASPCEALGYVGADVLGRGADSRRAADRGRSSGRRDHPHLLRRGPALPDVQRRDGAAPEAAAAALAACASRSCSPTRRSPRGSGASANRATRATERRTSLGTGVLLWATWQVTCFAGYWVGNVIPVAWSLDFVVPLCFLALLVPALEDGPDAHRRACGRNSGRGARRRCRCGCRSSAPDSRHRARDCSPKRSARARAQ